MLDITYTSKFKKDMKRLRKQGASIEKIDEVLLALRKGERLPQRCHDHELSGGYGGHRECHIEPDWLLVYRVEKTELVLTAVRTGSHSELFGM